MDVYFSVEMAEQHISVYDLGGNRSGATLGAEIQIPTLEGSTSMKIPRGTQSGQILRLSQQGIPNVRGYGQGDLLVQITVEIPKKLTRRQEEILRDFAQTEQKNVTPERKSFLERMKQFFEPI